ncbi:hypothetical protein PSACC_01323 [Paramicrosporidium saccamoebae]|uniref:Transcription factor Iwr1 domain-containing protein n=1 Tax=Paramicrosporidium saccamoebae TaxID=1246581 RepID=A0A2H9TME1_9FUNG|nr:hypothetical protein PSACC_01323 [Paramicrosporidium saccamoebae]
MSPPGLIRIKRSAEDPPLVALLCEHDEDTLYYQLMHHDESNKTACVEPVTLSEALEQIKIEALPVKMDEVKLEDETLDGFVYDYYLHKSTAPEQLDVSRIDEEDSLWEDDEDSNAEDYYQNDYPDEDDDNSDVTSNEDSDHWYRSGLSRHHDGCNSGFSDDDAY